MTEPRLPPADRHAEAATIGACLRDNKVIPDVVALVRVHDFYADVHQRIFRGMIALWHDGKAADAVTIAGFLKDSGQIEAADYSLLAELWDAAPSAGNATYYAGIVRDRAIQRDLAFAGHEIERNAMDQIGPGLELLESAERKIFSISQGLNETKTMPLIRVLDDALDRFDARSARPDQRASGVPTGWVDLDAMTSGLQNSELVIIAARPSVGKTAFGVNLFYNAVVREDIPTVFFSLEQSGTELGERLLCLHSRTDSHKMRSGFASGDDCQGLADAREFMVPKVGFLNDQSQISMLRIAAEARRLKMRHGIKLVIVDYLQLIEPENRREPRQEQVAGISRRLKYLARELAVPVVAMAQLNRTSEDRADKRPRLSDLRESGAIEQDADTVILLHRPDGSEGDGHTMEVIIGKQRNGRTGEINLLFVKQFMRFENFAVQTPMPRPFASTNGRNF